MLDPNGQQQLLVALRALENGLEDLRLDNIDALQASLTAIASVNLGHLAAVRESATCLAGLDIADGYDYLLAAFAAFCNPEARFNFGAAYNLCRAQQSKALQLFYRQEKQLPILKAYFRCGEALIPEPIHNLGHETGIVHRAKSGAHHRYSLYVPEYYRAAQNWPLIICLHGAFGSGSEYLWSWMRVARSYGYLLLSPKSTGDSWSIAQPDVDINSVMAMIDRVTQEYAIDESRIYLSGLSDGATFSYLLGLKNADRFAALAPVAGVLPPTADWFLRQNQGRQLPIHVVHGALDPIFSVQTVRSTSTLLKTLKYQITYTELPNWGHALTNRINEEIIFPRWRSMHSE